MKNKLRKQIVRLDNFILTKLKVQSINDVDILYRASNKLRVDEIKLGAVYVCYYEHDEILETILQEKNYIMMNLFLEGDVEGSDDESECNEDISSIWRNCL